MLNCVYNVSLSVRALDFFLFSVPGESMTCLKDDILPNGWKVFFFFFVAPFRTHHTHVNTHTSTHTHACKHTHTYTHSRKRAH